MGTFSCNWHLNNHNNIQLELCSRSKNKATRLSIIVYRQALAVIDICSCAAQAEHIQVDIDKQVSYNIPIDSTICVCLVYLCCILAGAALEISAPTKLISSITFKFKLCRQTDREDDRQMQIEMRCR